MPADLDPIQIIPKGPDTANWLTPHHREELRGRPVRRRHPARVGRSR